MSTEEWALSLSTGCPSRGVRPSTHPRALPSLLHVTVNRITIVPWSYGGHWWTKSLLA